MSQTHGGKNYTISGEPADFLDFSASLNPFGMPEEVRAAAMRGIALAERYPDPDCIALRRAIAAAQGVPAEQILCGNGAAELLDVLIRGVRPRRAMVCAPTFGEYERALRASECKIVYYYLKKERNFDLGEEILRILRPGIELLLLCTPNNPTGRTISQPLLEQIVCRCAKLGCTLVVDESFLELTDEEYSTELRPLLNENPHLVLLRSLTKSYCMPGLRLGYLMTAEDELLAKMRAQMQPWSVSVPAQMAGIAAMDCAEWCEDCQKLIRMERRRMQEKLQELGLFVLESRANFLLFQAEKVTDLHEKMIKYRILIRSCASFRGLGEDWYRVAVRTEEENERLLNALRKVLQRKGSAV